MRKALREVAGEVKVQSRTYHGYYGNRIVVMTAELRKRAEIDAFFRRMAEAGILEELLPEVPERVDEEGVFHFRLDKQLAYRGRLVLADHDDVVSVRAKVVVYPKGRERAIRAAEEYFRSLLESRPSR